MGRRRKGDPVHGWAVIDKPEGPTSTQVVNEVRRGLNAQKAGHGGTLDPLASGLLPIALGEATKTVAYVMDAPKTYVFTARWGEARTTDDREGEVVETSDHRPSPEDIRRIIPVYTGHIRQVPPVFSAVKVDGERAYDLARAGEEVELKARVVEIYELKLLECPDPDHAVFEMTCGKGTYVRALVRDMARDLGTCGHVHRIRRTQAGPFDEEDAIPLDQWRELVHKGVALEHLAPVETALDDIPALAVTERDAVRLRNGQPILLRDDGVFGQIKELTEEYEAEGEAIEPLVLCSLKGSAVALCRFERGELKPVRVFNLSS